MLFRSWELTQGYTSAVDKTGGVEFTGGTAFGDRVTYKNGLDVSMQISFDIKYKQQSMTNGQSWLSFVFGVDNNSFNDNSKGVTFIIHKMQDNAVYCQQNPTGIWNNCYFNELNTFMFRKGSDGWYLYVKNTHTGSSANGEELVGKVPFTSVSANIFENGGTKLSILNYDNSNQTNAVVYEISNFCTIAPSVNFGSYLVSDNNIITNIHPNTTVSNFVSLGNAVVRNDTTLIFKDENESILSANQYIMAGAKLEVYVKGVITKVYIIFICGDVKNDGLIDINDLVLLKQHLLKINILTGIYKNAGDTTNKGNVTISDAIAIKKVTIQSPLCKNEV